MIAACNFLLPAVGSDSALAYLLTTSPHANQATRTMGFSGSICSASQRRHTTSSSFELPGDPGSRDPGIVAMDSEHRFWSEQYEPAFRIMTAADLLTSGLDAVTCCICQGCPTDDTVVQPSECLNGMLLVPQSKAVRLRLMSLIGSDIARLNDKAYRELLSVRLEEERRMLIEKRIKDREKEEQDRKVKLSKKPQSPNDEETPGRKFQSAEDMVPQQLKQYLCLGPDEDVAKKLPPPPKAKLSVLASSSAIASGFSRKISAIDSRLRPRTGTSRQKRAPSQSSDFGLVPSCRCRCPEDCPVIQKKILSALHKAQCDEKPSETFPSSEGNNCGDPKIPRKTQEINVADILRTTKTQDESEDLRDRLDSIQDLDTLYSIADRLLLPPLQFVEEAQAEEPMKLSILENAVFDGNNATENASESTEDIDEFGIL
ncbi:unnamed protein product [Notodromas monacha]|uniref:Uncharacterized protein n=1 Tax=Notodromas monacha TaxID=399045 RepID=A0A7R9BG02_9CRUS|nr:unnamed protein product [Notodromas monacha]CAG0913455.1 unnamed protein product [Notodromas monacha]